LPPHTTTPLLYAIGISAFAQVYAAFESAWLLTNEKEQQNESTPQLNENIRRALGNLLEPRIQRSTTLDQDVSFLHQITSQCHGGDISEVVDSWRKSEMLREYLEHISHTISARPHVIVAYAWIMYMALFSGGRWIRMVLKDAGSEFWNGIRSDPGSGAHNETIQEEKKTLKGFTFLTFPGSHDGEDIKAAFKQQLAEVDELLSVQEKQDIVDEARYIFEKSIHLVHELDHLAFIALTKFDITLSAAAPMEKLEPKHRIVKETLKIEKRRQSTVSTQALQLLLAVVVSLGVLVVVDVLKKSIVRGIRTFG